jgi:hypothetical protein
MPFCYFRLFLVSLLCNLPARPLLRSYIVTSKALLSQLIATKNEITTGVLIRHRVHAAADSAYTFTKTPFVASGMSYSSLLVHYLSQNVKPKYGLCLNVISKIVEHEGPDAAIRTSESLKYNITAEGFHMANKALLSALVSQRHLEAASSHLRQLLLDQSEHRQVDATVVADLLQFHMAVDGDHDTTKVRRKYKKRAVEASLLYSDVIGTQLLSSEEFPQLHGVGIGTDEGYGDPIAKSITGSAVNRIHEYGARAFAESREWEQAVLAVGRIEEKHLSSPQLVSFCTQLLDRLVALNVPSADRPLIAQSAASGEQISNTPETDVDVGCYRSAALDFALSLPLITMPADSPLLHASLLVMSACPSNVQAVIALLEGAFSRQLDADTVAHRISHTSTAFLPEDVSLKLTKQLFMGGCSPEDLVQVMKILWGHEVLQNSSGDAGLYGRDGKDGSAITDRSYNASEMVNTLSQLSEDAVESLLTAACALRDLQGTEGEADDSQWALISSQSVVELPVKIIRALSTPPPRSPSAFSLDRTVTRNTLRTDRDSLNSLPFPLPVSLSRAIRPSLHCLCIALRLSDQKHRIGALIQGIEDACSYPSPEPTHQSNQGAVQQDRNSDSNSKTVPVPGQGDADDALHAVWSPSIELMVEVSAHHDDAFYFI